MVIEHTSSGAVKVGLKEDSTEGESFSLQTAEEEAEERAAGTRVFRKQDVHLGGPRER